MLNSAIKQYLKPFNCVKIKKSLVSFKNVIYKMCSQIIYTFNAFTNGPGERGSNKKMVLDAALLSTQHYKVQINGNLSNPGK